MIVKLALKHPVHRYIIVGGSIYLFELAVIMVVQWEGGSALFAVALSFWLGLLVSFGLQKLVTFHDRRLHRKVLLVQATAFGALVLFNFTFTLIVTKLLSPWLPAAMTRTLALGTTTIWNYYLYKKRIFRVDDKILPIN